MQRAAERQDGSTSLSSHAENATILTRATPLPAIPPMHTRLLARAGRAHNAACQYSRSVSQICPNLECPQVGEMTVAVTSLTASDVAYELSVAYVNTSLSFTTPQRVTISPWMPRYYKLDFGDHEAVDVLVKASKSAMPAIVSVQVRGRLY